MSDNMEKNKLRIFAKRNGYQEMPLELGEKDVCLLNSMYRARNNK
jgi:hypothetical protein